MTYFSPLLAKRGNYEKVDVELFRAGKYAEDRCAQNQFAPAGLL